MKSSGSDCFVNFQTATIMWWAVIWMNKVLRVIWCSLLWLMLIFPTTLYIAVAFYQLSTYVSFFYELYSEIYLLCWILLAQCVVVGVLRTNFDFQLMTTDLVLHKRLVWLRRWWFVYFQAVCFFFLSTNLGTCRLPCVHVIVVWLSLLVSKFVSLRELWVYVCV